MSVINKEPYIKKVLASLSSDVDNLKTLASLVDGGAGATISRSFVKLSDFITVNDKGVHRISLETDKKMYTGYLLYNNSYCAVVFYSDNQNLGMLDIDVANIAYKKINEYLDINELRNELNALLIEKGEGVKIQAGDIDSETSTTGQVLASDNAGGAEWMDVTEVIADADVQEGSAQYLLGLNSEGNVVKDELPEGIVVDQTIVEDSTQAVAGGAVYDALELKADKSDTYTKTEDDALLSEKAAIADLENGTLVPAKSLVAEQLENVSEDSGTTQDAPFLFQATATNGGAGASDTAPTAKYLKLEGKTYAFNQLIGTIGSETISGITFTNNGDGSITLSGIATANIYKYIGSFSLAGHTILLGFKNLINPLIGVNLREGNIGWYNSLMTIRTIGSSVSSTNLGIFVENGTDLTTPITVVPQMYDLTQLFNGDIPDEIINGVTLSDYNLTFTGVDLFNQLFPLPYYAYNAGSLVSANATLLTTYGKNQFDGVWRQGDTSGGSQVNVVSSTNFIKVVPAQKYQFKVKAKTTVYLMILKCFDGNNNFISETVKVPNSIEASYEFDIPSNAAYAKLQCNGQDVSHPIAPSDIIDSCFYIYWDGTRPDYEPYVKHEYELGSELETSPLLSAGSIKDIKTPDGVITRNVGVVDLGTLTLTLDSAGSGIYIFRTTSVYTNAKKPSSNSLKANIICGNYTAMSYDNLVSNETLNNIAVAANGYIYISNSSFSGKTSQQVQALLSGVYLYYELATPTTEQGTPFPAIIEVDDFGTMGYGGTNFNGYPQGCEFFYPADYVLFIDSLGSAADFDASNIALKSDVSAEQTARLGYDAILQNAIGGTLRQLLVANAVAAGKTLDFDNTAVVDMSTLTWVYDSTNQVFYCATLQQAVAGPYTEKSNILCTKYKTTNNKPVGSVENNTITNQPDSAIRLFLKDTTYTTVDTLVASLKGVLLAYEKASE